MRNCKICENATEFCFRHEILGKYKINYYYCSRCGLLQTEEPYWLEDAYSEAMQKLDVGIISRNEANSRLLSLILSLLIEEKEKCVDIGAGYGMLVRMMRDRGYDYYWQDEYCDNLFAKGFEVSESEKFKVASLFEVMEHIYDPLSFLQEKIALYGVNVIVFSTKVFESLPGEDWWYYSFEGGQHISFYQKKTLNCLASAMGFHYYSINTDYHLFTVDKLSLCKRNMLVNSYYRKIHHLAEMIKRDKKSKLWSDYEYLKSLIK